MHKNLRDEELSKIWQGLRGARMAIDHPQRSCSCGDTAFVPYGLLLTSIARFGRAAA